MDVSASTPAKDGPVDPAVVRSLLRYYPDVGVLTWIPRPVEMFPNLRSARAWNARYADRRALDTDDGRGYRMGRLFRKSVYAHRAAWVVFYGEWPVGQIDHINGNKADNRIHNLRDVSGKQNSRNLPLRARNSSGVTGVCWVKRYGKYVAYISGPSGRVHLGYFANLDDASSARRAAEADNNYHENHGRAQ